MEKVATSFSDPAQTAARDEAPLAGSGHAGVSDLAAGGYARFVDRALALFSLGVGLAIAVPVAVQSDSLEPRWLATVVVLLVACTLGQLIATNRSHWARGFFAAYAVVATSAMLSWPLAWTGPPLDGTPFIALPLVGSVIMLAWAARDVLVAVVTAPPVMTVFAWIRTEPGGGGKDVHTAALEAIFSIAVICGVTVAVSLCHQAGELLDQSADLAAARAEQAAILASVRNEQGVLDALVHDQVMTTLAAAGNATVSRDRLAGMAGVALNALGDAGETPDDSDPLTGDGFAELVTGLVGHVAGAASVQVDVGTMTVPRRIANALAQAAQEAALNAAKHAPGSRITVRVLARDAGGEVRVGVEVADDGPGFAVDEIPAGRLGVRLALSGRLEAIGGTAEVESEPGDGTVVRLSWTGPTSGSLGQGAFSPGRIEDNLDFDTLLLMLRVLLGVMLAGQLVHVLLGALPTVEWVAMAALVVGGHVALGPRAQLPLRRWEGVVISVTLVLALVFADFRVSDIFPGEVAYAVLYLALLRIRGSLPLAASAAGLFVATLLIGAGLQGDLLAAVPEAVSPILTVVLIDFHVRWLNRVAAKVASTQTDFEAAAARAASVFSSLLRREVWLVGVQRLVEPLLRRLADPFAELTAADRDRCLALEARLRDAITARNLASPEVATAIEAARERGVTVTLVDNRNGTLPEAARIVAQEQLASVAAAQSNGRIVARVAPAGYTDLVTIMTDTDEQARLISIREDGTVSER